MARFFRRSSPPSPLERSVLREQREREGLEWEERQEIDHMFDDFRHKIMPVLYQLEELEETEKGRRVKILAMTENVIEREKSLWAYPFHICRGLSRPQCGCGIPNCMGTRICPLEGPRIKGTIPLWCLENQESNYRGIVESMMLRGMKMLALMDFCSRRFLSINK